MAIPEHSAKLREGTKAWNHWRLLSRSIVPDLRGAYLPGADLRNTDFRDAILVFAELRGANLYNADLRGADIEGADLRGADLSRANLSRMDLSRHDFSEVNLTDAILNESKLHSTRLDGAILTGAHLWETQRYGWSVKSVVCERVYWDAEGLVPTDYRPGEFEKLHSEQPTIRLFYKGGITKFELTTLPALLHHLASKHMGCSIRLKSIQEAGGGASVSIVVEDTDPDTFERIREEAYHSQSAQIALRDNRRAQWEIEKQLLLDEVFPRMLAAAGQEVRITGQATGLVIATGNATVHTHQSINDVSAIRPLLDEITQRKAELGLGKSQTAQFDNAIHSVQTEVEDREPKRSVVSGGLKVIKEIVVKALESTAEKAITDHWWPLVSTLENLVKQINR
jgi:hypothetical protein